MFTNRSNKALKMTCPGLGGSASISPSKLMPNSCFCITIRFVFFDQPKIQFLNNEDQCLVETAIDPLLIINQALANLLDT